MAPRYKVTLTEEERVSLEALTRSGKMAASKFVHARALLLCDAGAQGSAWTVAKVAEALGVTTRTIEHLKARFVEEGIEALPWIANRQPERQILPSTVPSMPG